MDSRSDKPIVHANTIVEKVLSACCGSIITSLVTTPFDVVKTRIQFQSLNIQNERSRLPIPFQAQCCYNAEFCRGPTNPLPYAYSQLSIFNKEISKDLMKFNGTIVIF
jgi:solute carrier family 25 protein 39/40